MLEHNCKYQHIRDLREDADMSQSDVAKLLNCSQASYSYYEIGRRDIPTEVLIELSKIFHCSVDYLLGLSDEKNGLTALAEINSRLDKRNQNKLLSYAERLYKQQ